MQGCGSSRSIPVGRRSNWAVEGGPPRRVCTCIWPPHPVQPSFVRFPRRPSLNSVLQGEPYVKKLAQGEVLPLLLKSVETGGPEIAFAFLKMWKLAFQHVAKGGNYRAGSCKTYQNRGLGSCTMSVRPNMWTSNIGSQPESPSYFLKMLVLGRPIRLRLWPK